MARKFYSESSSSGSSHSDEVVGFRFLGVKIHVASAEQLGGKKFKSRLNKIDPYLVMGFGNMDAFVKGKTHKKAGQNLCFNEMFDLEWDEKSRYIKIVAMDHDTFSRDDTLGIAKLDCEMLHRNPGRHKIAFFRKGEPAGVIEMDIRFVAEPVVARVSGYDGERSISRSGSSSSSSGPPSDMVFDFMAVEIIVKSGEGIGGRNAPSKMNPFLVLRLSGETYKGRIHKHCRPNMRFGECFRLPYDGKCRSVKLCVIDRDRDGDDVLGVGKLDIPAIIKHPGRHEVPLFDRRGKDAGVLNVQVGFMAEAATEFVIFGSSSASY
eukprot:Lankesteria_metandrocarpae@DN375_c0_g1_i1.p1